MTLTQNWVGYLDRSYEQIKRSCLTNLGITAPEISDHSESNPLIIILSMFSGIGEMLNLYIDANARETFIGTARRYSSVVKLAKLIDYNIKARNPSSANLLFTLTNDVDVPTPLSSGTLLIPLGTIIKSINGDVPFILNQDIRIPTGISNVYGFATQFSPVQGDILGTTNAVPNQTVELPDNYVDGSLRLIINSEVWKEFRSFGIMFPNTKGFVVDIDENQQAFVEFGDGVNGAIPLNGQTIFADYKTSQGLSGNIPPGQITQLITTVPGIPSGLKLTVINPDYSSGGTNFETLEDIKNRAPRSIRTLERAVTYQDFLDLCYMVLGVGSAEISYCCGKYVDIYIAPNSPGAATVPLLQSVSDYINCRKIITTQISVISAGVSKIWIQGTVFGKPLITSNDIYNQVLQKLDDVYGYTLLTINRKISVSHIISIIESLSNVENFEITAVRIQPFPRPLSTTTNPLNITFNNLPTTVNQFKYTIQWNQSLNKFNIFRGSFLVNQLVPGGTYTDDVVSFTLTAGTYINGDKWEFTVFPSYPEIFPSSVIQIDDFSASIIEVGPIPVDDSQRTIFSELTIVTQGSSQSCLPEC